MKYRRIKNKTYNNVMYYAGLLETVKGYPKDEAIKLAIKHFDDDIFKYKSIETIFNNLLTYSEHLQRMQEIETNKHLGYFEY